MALWYIHDHKKHLRILAYLEHWKPYMHNFISGSLQHFEDFVAGHFRKQGRVILVACRAYMGGAQVASVIKDEVQCVDEDDKTPITRFKVTLKKLFEELLMEFTVKGADCDEFLAQNVEDGAAKAADTTLKL